MDLKIFSEPGWCYAATLRERAASLPADSLTVNPRSDHELASRRLQRWRDKLPFMDDELFAQRLELDGITERELLFLLGEPVEHLCERMGGRPSWLEELAEAFAVSKPSERLLQGVITSGLGGQDMSGFLGLIEPLIVDKLLSLRSAIAELLSAKPSAPFAAEEVETLLFAHLPKLLMSRLSRTMVFELNVARMRGLLEGDTPEARFESFVGRIRQRSHALELLSEYPVLARQLVIHTNQWLDFSLEFLRHLCADWEEIVRTFGEAGEPGRLVEVGATAGDSHRGGRSVLSVRFDSGLRLIYKPKSLAVDVHFQELLGWLNEHGTSPPFRLMKVLDRGAYGWTEFVDARECASAVEVGRFYERQGGYLALLHVLEATDFHYENLIASGEHPMLIDLESLFHPRPAVTGGPETPEKLSIVHSVMRVGLLPQRLWGGEEDESGLDISGLGAVDGQLTPQGMPYWEGSGTDQMRLTRKRLAMSGGQNRPALGGASASVLDYREELVRGFTNVYRTLLEHREALLAPGGPLDSFADDEVRSILRPTRFYGMLLSESFHPDVLRDALDRDRLFDQLWAGSEYNPNIKATLPSERADLERGDIPMFASRPGSRDLWTSSLERVADYYDEPSMSAVRRRIEHLGERDLKQQVWFIRASVASLSVGPEVTEATSYQLDAPRPPASRERLLEGARAVGDRLVESALREGDYASWVGLTLVRGRNWNPFPLGLDLYDGLSGVALFLAYLGEVTDAELYRELARGAVVSMRRLVSTSLDSLSAVGGFTGWGGVIYAYAHLGALWGDDELIAEAERLTELLPRLIEQDETFDVLGGAAGCIGGLLSLYRVAPSESVLAAANSCGRHLLTHARRMPRGIGWLAPKVKERPLTGYSHGAAGVGLALLELSEATGEERFRTAALEAFEYERGHFSSAAANWLDLRDPEMRGVKDGGDQESFMVAWCHGATGIGLARLRALRLTDDPQLRAEVRTAMTTTLELGFGSNHSLCHGDLGNLELFLDAGRSFDGLDCESYVKSLSAVILEDIRDRGWRCGGPTGVEAPGLMTGIAGIGYGLLRLAEPARVPSVLILAPPAA